MHIFTLLLIALATSPGVVSDTQAPAPLTRTAVVELPGVEGRIDHLAFDPNRERLWIAALENDSLEVVDVAQSKHVRSLRDLKTPTGIAFAAGAERALDRVLVANGGSGMLDAFDAETLERKASLAVGDDADNVRWDARHERAIIGVGAGGEDSALVLVDTRAWKVAARIPLAGHPESFQLDADGVLAFVNVPDAGHVACVDLEKGVVARTWKVTDAAANFPMAIDAARDTLLVGCRRPARLISYSLAGGVSGERFGTRRGEPIEMSGDVDDVFVDAALDRVYAACGAGFLDVFEFRGAGKDSAAWVRTATIRTAAGARTALFVPKSHRVFLALPHKREQKSAVWIYETQG